MPALGKALPPLIDAYLELGLGRSGWRDMAGVRKQEMSLEVVEQ